MIYAIFALKSMRSLAFILFVLASLSGSVLAQNGKSAHRGQTADSLLVDSLHTAANRGGELMSASRDSLRNGKSWAVSTVVDTFAMATQHDRAYSKLKESDIRAARKRIAESERDIEFAFGELALSKSKGMYTNKEIVAASTQIQAQKDRLRDARIWLDSIESEWKLQYLAKSPLLIEPISPQSPTNSPIPPLQTGGKGKHTEPK